MGGLCSTPKNPKQAPNPYAGRSTGLEKQFDQQRRQRRREAQREATQIATAQPAVEPLEKPAAAAEKEYPRLSIAKESPGGSARFSNTSDDEFYDGIPRYQKSSSYLKSRSLRAAKV